MPPDIRTGPMTLAAGTPPGRASALLAKGPPGSDPLAALFASLLADSGGPAPVSGMQAAALKKAVPQTSALIQLRPNAPQTAGVTAGPKKTEPKTEPKKTEPKTAEQTMDTSLVPASPDRDKAGAKPGGELPLQGAGANSSGLPALPVLLIISPVATPAPTATGRVLPLPSGQGRVAATSPVPVAETGLPPVAPVIKAGTSAPGDAAPMAAPVQPDPTVAPQQVLTAPVTLAAPPQVTPAALGAGPAIPAAPLLAELTVTDGPTATDGKSATDGEAATEGRTATAGSLITEGPGGKEASTAKEGKSATDGPITRDEQPAKDGGTATDGRLTANIKAATEGQVAVATESRAAMDGQNTTDGRSTTDGPKAMEGQVSVATDGQVSVATDGKSAMEGGAATGGPSATDGKMLTAGEPKTGLKSAAVDADTITRAQAVQPKALPADLQPLVSGTRPERRTASALSDAPPPLPAQAPAQAGAVSTEAKPLSAGDRAEVMRQAADGVAALPLPTKPGTPEQMTLQLHPKEWGQLQVSVTITPGPHPNAVQAVTAHIVAQNPQVKAALEGQSADLRQALREAGLHLDRISVTVQSTEASAQPGTATSGGRHEAHGGAGQGMGGAFWETAADQKTGMSGGTRTSDGTGMSGASGNGMPSSTTSGGSHGRQGSQPPPAYAAAYAPAEPEDVPPLGSPRRPASGQIDMRA